METKKFLLLTLLVLIASAACPGPNRKNGSTCKRNNQCASGWCQNYWRTKCASGSCKAKRNDGVTAYYSRAKSCKSGVQKCGICGNTNRANGVKCSADSQCSSGFCKGKGVGVGCTGVCKWKVANGLGCWKNVAGLCINRGCQAGASVCKVCGNTDLANGKTCQADNQCASGFCKGKNLANCNGVCKWKVADNLSCWKNGANVCIKRGCTTGKALCGLCGDTNRANGKTCEKDSNCASGYCRGGVLGSCTGVCKWKVADNLGCWKDGAGNCIDRACQSGVGFCGLCGGSSVKRDDGAKCKANDNCKSGFCSGKTPTCGGVCKTCPAECGESGCHERNGDLVCGDKNMKQWFSYLADDFSETLGGLQTCFKPSLDYAECIAPVVQSAGSCLKDTKSCKLSLCPTGQNCKCFAFEKEFTKETSNEYAGGKIEVTTNNEMTVTAVVTGGLQLTPKRSLEVMVAQNGAEPLIQLASTIEIEAKRTYEFSPKKWTDRRIPLSKPQKVVTKVIMAGVIPVIVQVLVTPVAYVTVSAKFDAGAKLTINLDGSLQLKNPLTAELEFGKSKNSKNVNFDLDGFSTSNFIEDYSAVAEYKMKASAKFNVDVKVGAEFALMIEGVTATVFPSFEAKIYAKGRTYARPRRRCSECATTSKTNCRAVVEVGAEVGIADPQALINFDPKIALGEEAESEPKDGCFEVMDVAKVACTAISADGGCNAMTTICKKSVDVLDVVTPDLKVCIPNVELFSVNFPSIKLPNTSWQHKEKFCFAGSRIRRGFLAGRLSFSKDEGVKVQYRS